MKQVMPVFENLVIVEYLNGGEEPVASRESHSGVLPQFTDVIARGMESEGYQVEHEQQIGQTIFTTSGIMLHVIATVFKRLNPQFSIFNFRAHRALAQLVNSSTLFSLISKKVAKQFR